MKDKELHNKVFALVGGTGTLGNALTEYILKNLNPKRIRIISRDEKKQQEMAQKFAYNGDKLRFFIGDIRDKPRMMTALHDVDYVIHAAALKQVPSCEYNPFEAVKTNILGTQNVIEASIENRVKTLVCLSTDKAVSPLNLYGATKMCLERLAIAGNVYNRNLGDTKIIVTRYGNVINSRGSVIELWEKQLKEGQPLTLTDERMTRFWMPIETAVKLIITAIKEGRGGEIFIPKAPKVLMKDVANETATKYFEKQVGSLDRSIELGRIMMEQRLGMVRTQTSTATSSNCADIKITGLRPSEKLFEVLINEHEANRTLEFKEHYIILPEFLPASKYPKSKKYKGGSYTSEI